MPIKVDSEEPKDVDPFDADTKIDLSQTYIHEYVVKVRLCSVCNRDYNSWGFTGCGKSTCPHTFAICY